MPQAVPERVPPETKDWTWVLHERCPQCSLDAGVLTLSEIPMVIRTQVQVWPVVLLRRNVAERPAPQVWSPLEYGAHTRDVLRLFQERLARMLTEDEPTLADWDPNEAALQGGYHDADPDTVAAEILTEAEKLATAVEAVPAGAAERRGLRSDGAAFTVTTLLQYLVHDLVHHLWDVTDSEPDAESVVESGAQADAGFAPDAEGDTGSEAGSVSSLGAAVSAGEDGSQAQDGGRARTPGASATGEPDHAGAAEGGAEDGGGETSGRHVGAAHPGETSTSGEASTRVDDRPGPPPIQAFANRHRRTLGITMAVIAVALTVLDLTVLPQPDAGEGVRAFVLRWAAPVCWMMIAGVALTWALSVRRTVVNAFAYVAVACWLVYLGARVI